MLKCIYCLSYHGTLGEKHSLSFKSLKNDVKTFQAEIGPLFLLLLGWFGLSRLLQRAACNCHCSLATLPSWRQYHIWASFFPVHSFSGSMLPHRQKDLFSVWTKHLWDDKTLQMSRTTSLFPHRITLFSESVRLRHQCKHFSGISFCKSFWGLTFPSRSEFH